MGWVGLETPSAFHATEKRESGSRCTLPQPLAPCSAYKDNGADGGGGGGTITRAGAPASDSKRPSGGGGGNGKNDDTDDHRSILEERYAEDDDDEKATGEDSVLPPLSPRTSTRPAVFGIFGLPSVLFTRFGRVLFRPFFSRRKPPAVGLSLLDGLSTSGSG